MKRIQLLIASSIFIASTASAQISKGSVLLGGGISASKSKSESGNDEGKFSGIGLNPSLGFAIKDNQVFGMNAGYGRSKSKYNNSSPESKANNYNVGIFFRRYLPLGKSFYLFGEAGAGYHDSKSESGATTTSTSKFIQKQSSAAINLFPGITYAVGKRFHLEASINNLLSLSYNKTINEQISFTTTTKNENRGVSLGVNASNTAPLTLGFRFVLGK